MAALKVKTDIIQSYVFDRYSLKITNEDFINLTLFFNDNSLCEIELRDKNILNDLFMDDLSNLLDLALLNKIVFQISYDKPRHFVKIAVDSEKQMQYSGDVKYIQI